MITCQCSNNTEYIVPTIFRQYIIKILLGPNNPTKFSLAYTGQKCSCDPNEVWVTRNDHDPPWSSRPSSVLSCFQGKLVGVSYGHKICSGLKVGVPKVDVNWEWDCTLCIPDKFRISPKFYGSESRHRPIHRSDRNIACTIAILWKTTAWKLHATARLSPWRKLTSLGANYVQLHKK